jgi:hypothetical protein
MLAMSEFSGNSSDSRRYAPNNATAATAATAKPATVTQAARPRAAGCGQT